MAKPTISPSAGTSSQKEAAEQFRFADIPSVEFRQELFPTGETLSLIVLNNDDESVSYMKLDEAYHFAEMLGIQISLGRKVEEGIAYE